VETTQQAPLILGAADGEAVTLVDCRQRRFSVKWGMTKDWRQTLDARLMLVGIWLGQPDEKYFDKIVIGVDHLLAWSRQSGKKDSNFSSSRAPDTGAAQLSGTTRIT